MQAEAADFRSEILQISHVYICGSTTCMCRCSRGHECLAGCICPGLFLFHFFLQLFVCLSALPARQTLYSLPIMLVIRHTWDTTKSLVTMTSNQDKAGHFCIFLPGVVFLSNFSCNGKSRVGPCVRGCQLRGSFRTHPGVVVCKLCLMCAGMIVSFRNQQACQSCLQLSCSFTCPGGYWNM